MNRTSKEIAENEVEEGSTYTEKSFLQSILTSVITIVACIACFAGATWAWCTDDVSSFSNTIVAANYNISITVRSSDVQQVVLSPKEVVDTEGYYEYKFGEGTYNVTMEASGTATNCYCIVIIGDDNSVRYFTDLVTINGSNNEMNFKIITDSEVTVKFYTRGGSHEQQIGIEDNCTIDLTASSANE